MITMGVISYFTYKNYKDLKIQKEHDYKHRYETPSRPRPTSTSYLRKYLSEVGLMKSPERLQLQDTIENRTRYNRDHIRKKLPFRDETSSSLKSPNRSVI
jgi:hypothetical protein